MMVNSTPVKAYIYLAVVFMEAAPMISAGDKEKIYHQNAEKLFRL
jgi:hypothetical protein